MDKQVWTKTPPSSPGWWWYRTKKGIGVAEIRGDIMAATGLCAKDVTAGGWWEVSGKELRGVEWSSTPIREPEEA